MISHLFNQTPVTAEKYNYADQHRISDPTCGGGPNVDAVPDVGKTTEKSTVGYPIPILQGFPDNVLFVGQSCQNPLSEK